MYVGTCLNVIPKIAMLGLFLLALMPLPTILEILDSMFNFGKLLYMFDIEDSKLQYF